MKNCIKDNVGCEVGTHMEINVNSSKKYGFYVLNDTNGMLTLLMDSNLITNSKVKWYDSKEGRTALGPVTSLEEMNNLTSTWNYIDLILNYVYDNTLERGYEGSYQKLKIVDGEGIITDNEGNEITLNGVSRARLLSLSEVTNLGCQASGSKCSSWLYDNLTDSPGYWLLTTNGNSGRNAYVISSSGDYKNYSAASPTGYGLRPVIYIKKMIEK